MTTTDQWEYCRLWITNAKEHKKGAILGLGGQSQGWGYDSGVVYVGASGDVVSETLTNKDQVCAFHPFLRMMGLLGGAGWELTNLQHGNAAIAESGGGNWAFHSWWDTLSWNNAVAYFKRRVIPGRTVNEPKLSL